MKQLSDHKVIRSVRRKIEVPTAPLEDTGVRSEDEVSDEEQYSGHLNEAAVCRSSLETYV